MTKNTPINIAIIDDGVNQSDFNLSGSWAIGRDLKVTDEPCNQIENHDSHGTICAKIMRKYLKKGSIDNIRFHSVAVLDSETMHGNVDQLVAAFELCSELDMRVIHLSIGSSYYRDFPTIKKCAEELHKKGAIMIAALSNRGTMTYPACLPYVIGVKSDASLRDSRFCYFSNPLDGIEIAASSSHILRNGKGRYITPTANSYAVPVATGKVISYLLENPNLQFGDIHNALMKDAIKTSGGQASKPSKDIEIPVVAFEAFAISELCPMMVDLRHLFWQNEYNCRVALNNPQTAISDFDVMPNDMEAMKYLCEFWDCDVLLVELTDDKALDYLGETSVIVKNGGSGCENAVEKYGDRFEICLNEKNIGWLFETILKILT